MTSIPELIWAVSENLTMQWRSQNLNSDENEFTNRIGPPGSHTEAVEKLCNTASEDMAKVLVPYGVHLDSNFCKDNFVASGGMI